MSLQKNCYICVCRKSGIFAKDIIIKENDYDEFFSQYEISNFEKNRIKRATNRRGKRTWEKISGDEYVYIPYIINEKLSKSFKKSIYKAIQDYNNRTCIRFIPKSKEKDFIEFKQASKYMCASSLGKVGKKQRILLGKFCNNHGTIIHEMMHALAVDHEQTRPDRDRHIKINWKNVSQKVMFAKRKRHLWSAYGTSYDLSSVMQYGSFDGSENGKPTILTRNNEEIKRSDEFSLMDIIQLNKMYRCSKKFIEMAIEEKKDQCVDLRRSCIRIAKEGKCKKREFKEFVETSCRLSCEFCKLSYKRKSLRWNTSIE